MTKDSFQVRVELGFLLGPLHSRIEREVRAFCDEHFGGDEQPDRGRPVRLAARRRGNTRSVPPQ